MKIIRVTTDLKVDVLDYPEGSIREELDALRKLIGPKCDLVEHVRPERLYTALGASAKVSYEKGSGVSMLVDEEGLYHELPANTFGSFLYGTDKCGHPIVGDILIIGEYDSGDGYSFSGLSDTEFNKLLPKIRGVADMINTLIAEGGVNGR